jgi:hypothetical protein
MYIIKIYSLEEIFLFVCFTLCPIWISNANSQKVHNSYIDTGKKREHTVVTCESVMYCSNLKTRITSYMTLKKHGSS